MFRIGRKRDLAIWKALAFFTLPVAACTISTTDKNADNGGTNAGPAGGDSAAGDATSSGGSTEAGRANGGSSAGGKQPTPDPDLAGAPGAGGVAGDAGSAGNGGEPGGDGGTGGGCIGSVNTSYVVRTDRLAVAEGPPERVVVDASSGILNTPLANVLAAQQQEYAACAVIKGGTVACWQQDAANGNLYGQLGNGGLDPVAVYRASTVLKAAGMPLTKVVSLASGLDSDAACAVTSDGKLWCWGNLTWIVNGGTKLYSPYAQTVMGPDGQSPLTGVIQATVGYQQACALIGGSPNTVWCWGTNRTGELGQGDTKDRQYAVQVPMLTDPSKVVLSYNGSYAGYNYGTACALDGGAVECWGNNDNGATGSSAGTNPVPAPTLVTTSTGTVLRGVVDLIEGRDGFAVLRNDSTIWTWGNPAGNTAYAQAYGVPNVKQVAWAGGASISIRYLTTDNVYHNGMASLDVSCGDFE